MQTGIDTDGSMTANRLAVYADKLERAQAKAESDLNAMYQELCNLKPAETEANLQAKKSWADAMRSELLSTKMDLATAKDTMLTLRGALPTTRATRESLSPAARSGGIGALAFKKKDFPSFTGELEDYPSFKKHWANTITPHLGEEHQLDQIALSVPSKDKTDIKCLTTMKDMGCSGYQVCTVSLTFDE